ncbi:biotin/lipoyl-containing protein [Immundisolibacter sp.]
MQQTLAMPKLGLTMTEGLVMEWRRAPGGSFAAGDVLAVIETDKIASEVEAPAAGRLQAILVAAGQTVPVGTPLAQWVSEEGAGLADGTIPAPQVASVVLGSEEPAVAVSAVPTAAVAPPPAQPSFAAPGQRIIATPYARRLAGERGVALEAVAGHGPDGRIRAADVPLSAPALAHAPTRTKAEFSAFGEHFLLAGIDAAAILDWRARLPTASQAGLGSLVLYVAARVLVGFDAIAACGVADGAAVPASIATRGLLAFLAALRAPAATPGHGLLFTNAGLGGIRLFAPARPAGWSALLGLGSLCDGRFELALRADPAHWSAASAAAYLERLRAGLRDPRTLLL